MVSWEPIVSNAVSSTAAGILSRTVCHPLDTAKARLQSEGMHYAGPLDVLKRTYRGEGIRGLYRGFSTVIAGGTPGTVIYLCSYEYFKEYFSQFTLPGRDSKKSLGSGHFVVHFACGMFAEACACLVYVPVDVIKERLQVQKQGAAGSYKGGVDALKTIMENEGIRGIYKGYGATMLSFGPFSALYFLFFERFKEWSMQVSDSRSISTPLLVASSSGAGAVASFLTSPLDLAKLRLQVQRGAEANLHRSETPYSSVLDCLLRAFEKGGTQEIFRGAGARVLHFVPATTITMTSFELLRRAF